MDEFRKRIELGTKAAAAGYGVNEMSIAILILLTFGIYFLLKVFAVGSLVESSFIAGFLSFVIAGTSAFYFYYFARRYMRERFGEVGEPNITWKDVLKFFAVVAVTRLTTQFVETLPLSEETYLYGWLAIFALLNLATWLFYYRGVSRGFLYLFLVFAAAMLVPWRLFVPNLQEIASADNVTNAALITFLLSVGATLLVAGIVNYQLATALLSRPSGEASYESV